MENQEPNAPHEEPPGLPPDFWSRRRWLARLSFTFLILAVYLGYVAYDGSVHHGLSRGRTILYYVSAMLAFVLFLTGTRERHRE